MPNNIINTSVALLILAHNESIVIKETVEAIQKVLADGDKLFVVADHCTDSTEIKARNAGAKVIIRNGDTPEGKGDALGWFVQEYKGSLKEFSRLVVLDADSTIKPDFIDRVKENITDSCVVMQCFVYPQFEGTSPIGKLAALSEFHDQYISDRIRTVFGWPVRMRGTGMVIRPDLLFGLNAHLKTKVEDIALSLIFASKGIQVKRLDEAILFDPKPPTMAAAARQRARWFRGQWRAVWQYRREIIQVLLKGPAGWSLLSSLFLKPKWLVLTISLLLAFVFSSCSWIALPFWIYFIVGSIYLFVGLSLIPERYLFFRTLLHIPGYVWMWLRGIILSLRSTSWLRVRK
ncbi:MAG: glycosyltransferase [Anaerolineae bacterium]|jgi:cellulose synthase/poly-beta-1,6-N-acetylglucosamine synthase-like glycosyltransferase|nr:glycosyltransferase [Anaerolineae bacterium]MBT7192172.1 glycosyltransferase [Anaerolineae bacterium]MBT7989507.1 glycosyltransferase [Anaerolineae bacterium]